MNAMSRFPVLPAGIAVLALQACGTEEITRPFTAVGTAPDADRGELMIWFTPPDQTFEDQQARAASSFDTTQYHVFMDGAQLIWDNSDYGRDPVVAIEGAGTGAGHLPAGLHHFEIAAAGGGRTIFTGDGEIAAASINRLYLFGDRGAVHGRFLSFPTAPAAGTLHVSVVNLIRRGPGIELVSCTGGTACAPLSPPLALGDVFQADFPAGETRETSYQLASGASIGSRQLPTAEVPSPPVFMIAPPSVAVDPNNPSPPPANFVFAPVFMSLQGAVQTYYAD